MPEALPSAELSWWYELVKPLLPQSVGHRLLSLGTQSPAYEPALYASHSCVHHRLLGQASDPPRAARETPSSLPVRFPEQSLCYLSSSWTGGRKAGSEPQVHCSLAMQPEKALCPLTPLCLGCCPAAAGARHRARCFCCSCCIPVWRVPPLPSSGEELGSEKADDGHRKAVLPREGIQI